MDLNLQVTRVFDTVWSSDKRFVILQGGTRSSKTYSIMQYILVTCLNSDTPLLVSIVRKTFPSLKKSVLRDWIGMLQEYGLYDIESHNKSDNTFKVGQCTVEFISIDQSQKIRGASRDILWLNECNEIPYESFFQLQVRTKGKILLDYNPTELVGWWIDLRESRSDEVDFDISTFRDNPFLEQSIVEEIERLRDVDPDYYQIYNLGVASRSTEAIYRYEVIDEIPVEESGVSLLAIGMDFGFTNDPTAILEVWKRDNTLYVNELLYERGLTNQDIGERLKEFGITRHIDIIADSAEMKSIEEIRRMGYRIHPARKGPDSVRNGIDILKRHRLCVTSESTNIIKELQLYKWKKDPNGVMLNIPVDAFNHALDALRYVGINTLGNKNAGKYNISIGGAGRITSKLSL